METGEHESPEVVCHMSPLLDGLAPKRDELDILTTDWVRHLLVSWLIAMTWSRGFLQGDVSLRRWEGRRIRKRREESLETAQGT